MAAIALFVSIAAINAPGGVVAGELATGTITGVVFDDVNGDGVQNEGEPNLAGRTVMLRQDGVFLRYLSTGSNGRYVADGLEPGEYTLKPIFDESAGACPDLVFSFNPVQGAYCQDFALPRNADPAGPVLVNVESGMTAEINFATQPADVAVVTGVALLEDDVAPEGASVVAYVNGQKCGSATAWRSRGHGRINFTIHVLGAGERAGCAVPGDTVEFRVEDVPAADGFEWLPYTAASFPVQVHHIVAMQDHAWYWFESDVRGGPLENNVLVEALVGSTVCGEVKFDSRSRPALGFGRLIVPSAEIEPGCGRLGVDVTFRVDGVSTKGTVAWEAGLQRIDLAVPGDANCDMTLSAIDATLVLQLEAGLVDDVPCSHIADVTGDGLVDSRDAVLILQFEAGLLFEVVHVDFPGPRPWMPIELGDS
ncbi:MAG: hypothetical protein IIC91_08615 [Chloroflexi bacterium]|nr:hypothetical protein [Chloroflexota bacterium]